MANITIETETNRVDIYYNDISASYGNKYETVIPRFGGLIQLDILTSGDTVLTLPNNTTLTLNTSNVDSIDGVSVTTNAEISDYFEELI